MEEDDSRWFSEKITLSPIPDEPATVAFLEDGRAGALTEENGASNRPARPEPPCAGQRARVGQWSDTFRLKGRRVACASSVHEITDEAYAVYFPTITALPRQIELSTRKIVVAGQLVCGGPALGGTEVTDSVANLRRLLCSTEVSSSIRQQVSGHPQIEASYLF